MAYVLDCDRVMGFLRTQFVEPLEQAVVLSKRPGDAAGLCL